MVPAGVSSVSHRASAASARSRDFRHDGNPRFRAVVGEDEGGRDGRSAWASRRHHGRGAWTAVSGAAVRGRRRQGRRQRHRWRLDGTGHDGRPSVVVELQIRACGGDAVAVTTTSPPWRRCARRDQRRATRGSGRRRGGHAGILRDRMFVNMTEDEWDAVIRRPPLALLRDPHRRRALARPIEGRRGERRRGCQRVVDLWAARRGGAEQLRGGEGRDRRAHRDPRRGARSLRRARECGSSRVAWTRMTEDVAGIADMVRAPEDPAAFDVFHPGERVADGRMAGDGVLSGHGSGVPGPGRGGSSLRRVARRPRGAARRAMGRRRPGRRRLGARVNAGFLPEAGAMGAIATRFNSGQECAADWRTLPGSRAQQGGTGESTSLDGDRDRRGARDRVVSPTLAGAQDALEATEIGVTDDTITVTVVAAIDVPGFPGLFQGNHDGVDAWGDHERQRRARRPSGRRQARRLQARAATRRGRVPPGVPGQLRDHRHGCAARSQNFDDIPSASTRPVRPRVCPTIARDRDRAQRAVLRRASYASTRRRSTAPRATSTRRRACQHGAGRVLREEVRRAEGRVHLPVRQCVRGQDSQLPDLRSAVEKPASRTCTRRTSPRSRRRARTRRSSVGCATRVSRTQRVVSRSTAR